MSCRWDSTSLGPWRPLSAVWIGIFDLLKNPFDIPFSLSVLFNKDVLPYCWLVALESFLNIAGYWKSETKQWNNFMEPKSYYSMWVMAFCDLPIKHKIPQIQINLVITNSSRPMRPHFEDGRSTVDDSCCQNRNPCFHLWTRLDLHHLERISIPIPRLTKFWRFHLISFSIWQVLALVVHVHTLGQRLLPLNNLKSFWAQS